MNRMDKEKEVAALSGYMKRAKASFVVGFQGLNVERITAMRKELRQQAGEMKVFRNTLLRRALERSDLLSHLEPSLKGANAFVFAMEDPCSVAKIVGRYVKETEILKIKTGILDNKGIQAQDIKMLGSLPALPVLQAKLLALLSAPMQNLLAILSAVPAGFVRLINEKQKK